MLDTVRSATAAAGVLGVLTRRYLCLLQVVDIMVPLLKFYFHEEVRRAAVQSLPQLLHAAQEAVEKGVPGATAAFVSQMLEFMWGPLMAALQKEPDPDVQARWVRPSCCLLALHACLSKAYVRAVSQLSMHAVLGNMPPPDSVPCALLFVWLTLHPSDMLRTCAVCLMCMHIPWKSCWIPCVTIVVAQSHHLQHA